MPDPGSIVIYCGPVVARATLADTLTARTIYDNLPLDGMAQILGQMIYFQMSVEDIDIIDEGGVEVTEPGLVFYWPDQTAFCIYFGESPEEMTEEVIPIAHLEEGVEGAFADIFPETIMRVEKGP